MSEILEKVGAEVDKAVAENKAKRPSIVRSTTDGEHRDGMPTRRTLAQQLTEIETQVGKLGETIDARFEHQSHSLSSIISTIDERLRRIEAAIGH